MLPDPTIHLQFRQMREADLEQVEAVLSAPDPVPTARPAPTRADAERWIAWNVKNYADHGFGLWVVQTHDGEFVGDCGLTIQDVEGEALVEVGYHVLPAFRGKGFATEAAKSVVDAARRAGVQHLVAIIRPANLPSQRVAAKIGLRFEHQVFKNGGAALVFGADLQEQLPVDEFR